MSGKALLLYNPFAGRVRLSPRRLSNLLEKLHGMGLMVQAAVSPTRSTDPFPRFSDYDLLIIHGGDGTFHNLIPAILASQKPVALLPAGTANVLARELGIPLQPERALRLIRGGSPRRIHVGQARDKGGVTHYFHLMAGIGVDGYVISRTSPRLKRSLGSYSYWWAGFTSFWSMPLQPFQLKLDGREHEATFAVVSNSRYYGGQLLMAPDASLFDHALDVCLFTSTSRSRFLAYLYGSVLGTHVRFPDVIYRKASEVEVLGDPSIPVQMDGDVVERLPMSMSTCAQAIEILAP